MWIVRVPPGVCEVVFLFFTQTIYPSLSTFPLMNTTASQTDHYHSNLSRLESQQVELAPAGHAAVTKHRWRSPTRPPLTHYADIWRRRRGGARMLMQSGCENISRAAAKPHPRAPNHPLPTSSNHSLCPFNYHHVASATSGESLPASNVKSFFLFSFSAGGLHSVTVVAGALTKQFAYLLKYYRNEHLPLQVQ